LVGRTGLVGVVGLRNMALSKSSASSIEVRSLDDREWTSDFASRSARALVGDFRALGRPSSSIVFPRDRVGARVSVRLRMVMPWRCLSLRF
jgi:hypothetical protein